MESTGLDDIAEFFLLPVQSLCCEVRNHCLHRSCSSAHRR